MTIGDGHDLKSSRFAGDEVLEACYDRERVLQRGDSGSAVKKVQEALIILEIPVPGVGASGTFGDETELAVRSYQEARGLKVDGIIGSETLGSLDEEFHTGPASEHMVSPATEPYVSEVPMPLEPESPVKPPRMPPVSAPGAPEAPSAPTVEQPRAPPVQAAPVVETVRAPPVPPVPPVPEVSAQPESTARRSGTTPPSAQPVTPSLTPTDSQGRKFHSAGTWEGSRAFEVQAGKSVHFEVTNRSNIESNIRIKANIGEAAALSLPSETTKDVEFSMMEKEPFIWRFYIETDNDKSVINWKLYSNWVPEV